MNPDKPPRFNFAPIPEATEKTGKAILDAAFKVHTALGPGLLESVYESALIYELKCLNMLVRNQVVVPVQYRELMIPSGFRMDLLVEDSVVVELKTVEKLLPIHEAQILTYLRMANIRLGFLLNFNVVRLKEGIKRLVN